MFKKVISLALSLVFSLQTCGFAQTGQFNLSGYLGQGGGAPALDRFRPAHLRYFSYEPDSDNFQILLDKADEKDLSDVQVKDKADELMRYFRIGLSLPNDKFWVNLRPDAPEQIIDPALEQTDMGKIMLEADLQLKKDTSSLTSPQTKEGKEYWDKLYKKVRELFGSDNITIPTITRPWIVPGEIIVRQSGNSGSTSLTTSAYIYKAALKVMLEEDYLNNQKTDYNFPDPRMKELNKYSTQLIRELIIPHLTKEVNRARRYAGLRQVYYSLILARWFKQSYHNSGATERQGKSAIVNENNTLVKLVDSGSLDNLTSQEPWSKDTYYQGYKKSFEQGEYNLSETVHTPTGQVIRRYVSGGITAGSALEVNDHFNVGKVNSSVYLGDKDVLLNGNSVSIAVSSGIESKKAKKLTMKRFERVFNKILWPDIGTVYSYSLENDPKLGRRISAIFKKESKKAAGHIVIKYGDRVPPSDIIGFIYMRLSKHLKPPQDKSKHDQHIAEPGRIIKAIKSAGIYATLALTLDEAQERVLGLRDNFLRVLKENGDYKLWKNHELSRLFVSLIKEIELPSFVEGLGGFIKVLEEGKEEFKKPYDDEKNDYLKSGNLTRWEFFGWDKRWNNVSRAYDEMRAGFKEIQNKLMHNVSSALTRDEVRKKIVDILNESLSIKLDTKTKNKIETARNFEQLYDIIVKILRDIFQKTPEEKSVIDALTSILYRLKEGILVDKIEGMEVIAEKTLETIDTPYRPSFQTRDDLVELSNKLIDSINKLQKFLAGFPAIKNKVISLNLELISGKLTEGQISLLETLLPANKKIPQDAIDIINRFLSCPLLYSFYLNGLRNKMYLLIGQDDSISNKYADVYKAQNVREYHHKRETYFLALSRDLLISALLFKAYPKAVWSKNTIKEVNRMLHSLYDFDEDQEQRIEMELNLKRIAGTEIVGIIKKGSMLKIIGSLVSGKVEEILLDYGKSQLDESTLFYADRLIETGIEKEANVLYAALTAFRMAYQKVDDVQKEVEKENPNNRIDIHDIVNKLAPFIAEYLLEITDEVAVIESISNVNMPVKNSMDIIRYTHITKDDARRVLELAKEEYNKEQIASSGIVSQNRLGAVDFRAMDMFIQPAGSFRGLDFSPAALSDQALAAIDLERDLEGINQMTLGRRRSHPQRLKEYVSACIFKGKIDEKADDFILSMREVFQLQAEEGIESSSQDREAVVLADTRGYVPFIQK